MPAAVLAVRRATSRVVASPRAAVAVAGTASLILAVLATLTRSNRRPAVPDELSYLLAAETFASGRLTNPPHPMWEHFQAEHILVLPTYQSKYPPGQGLVLALGDLMGSHPIVGVWLSVAALGAALCWMLQAWVGHRWAFFGTLGVMPWIAVSYWGFTYWGGALAAFGGALVFGALRRLHPTPRPWYGVVLGALFGAGVLVLANTRMYEGFLTSLPAGLYLAYWFVRRDPTGRWFRRAAVAVPLVLVLAAGGLLMARYNEAVTGSALTLPYNVYARQYERSPYFLWMRPRDPYLRPGPAGETTDDLHIYERERTTRGFLATAARRAIAFGVFFVPLPLAVATALGVRRAVRDRWVAGAVAILGFVMLGMTVSFWFGPHYAAPLMSLAVAVPLASLRALRYAPVGRSRWRRLVAPATVLGACAALGVVKGLTYLVVKYRTDRTSWAARRDQFATQLREMGGRHLVLVRYAPGHNTGDEWVSNAADIDRAPVVWARSLDPQKDQRLLSYFKDRRVWTVRVDRDDGPFALTPLETTRR